MRTTAAGLVPEDVLVLETAGTLDDFLNAAWKESRGWSPLLSTTRTTSTRRRLLRGEEGGARTVPRTRVPDVRQPARVFRQLLKLWSTWQRGEDFQRGLTKWRDVFALLRDIRPWSVRDRLEETGVLEDWRGRLEWEREQLPCEIELWGLSSDRQATYRARFPRTREGSGTRG